LQPPVPANAIADPSDDHDGVRARMRPPTSSTLFEPSAFITWILEPWPSANRPEGQLETNAMRPPLGDHAGSQSSVVSSVSRVTREPSAFMTQIWPLPPRCDTNAIIVPSGDQLGSAPVCSVRPTELDPSASIT